MLRLVFGDAYAREFGIALWDGTRIAATEDERFVLQVNSAGALRIAFAPPLELSVGRAFGAGLLDVEGSLEGAVDALFRAGFAASRARAGAARVAAAPPAARRSCRGCARRSSADECIRAGATARRSAFTTISRSSSTRAFSIATMVYSCAYFDDGVETLDDAQSAKLDYTLRKLRLRAGERLLDIGCGWGALVIRAAQLGVHALGITLSRLQCEEARRRIASAGSRRSRRSSSAIIASCAASASTRS